MLNVWAIISRVSLPLEDEEVIAHFMGIYDAQVLDVDHIVENLDEDFQRLVDWLRLTATGEEDHQDLDDYLSAKRLALATWRRRYLRAYRSDRRRLLATIRGRGPIRPDGYAAYLAYPWRQLRTLLFQP